MTQTMTNRDLHHSSLVPPTAGARGVGLSGRRHSVETTRALLHGFQAISTRAVTQVRQSVQPPQARFHTSLERCQSRGRQGIATAASWSRTKAQQTGQVLSRSARPVARAAATVGYTGVGLGIIATSALVRGSRVALQAAQPQGQTRGRSAQERIAASLQRLTQSARAVQTAVAQRLSSGRSAVLAVGTQTTAALVNGARTGCTTMRQQVVTRREALGDRAEQAWTRVSAPARQTWAAARTHGLTTVTIAHGLSILAARALVRGTRRSYRAVAPRVTTVRQAVADRAARAWQRVATPARSSWAVAERWGLVSAAMVHGLAVLGARALVSGARRGVTAVVQTTGAVKQSLAERATRAFERVTTSARGTMQAATAWTSQRATAVRGAVQGGVDVAQHVATTAREESTRVRGAAHQGNRSLFATSLDAVLERPPFARQQAPASPASLNTAAADDSLRPTRVQAVPSSQTLVPPVIAPVAPAAPTVSLPSAPVRPLSGIGT